MLVVVVVVAAAVAVSICWKFVFNDIDVNVVDEDDDVNVVGGNGYDDELVGNVNVATCFWGLTKKKTKSKWWCCVDDVDILRQSSQCW